MDRDYKKENSLEYRLESLISKHRDFLGNFRRTNDNYIEIDDVTAFTEISKVALGASDITEKMILGLVALAIEENVNFYNERFEKTVNVKQFANDLKFSLAQKLQEHE